VLTAADGTWKYSLETAAGDDWKLPDFDDSAWPALAAAPVPQLGQQDSGLWHLRRCTDSGAACLGVQPWPTLPERATVLVRKVFDVAGPAEGGGPS
jgi:hypothetical protein